ncbi:MAG: cytochrome-c peroxidase [Chitinophagales bacterium]|nr:hypothetical protein [Chitinophagaceae bacterium]MCB9064944.1 cytochrome-c peroxidase [Chitinophagales bacterium]
MKKQLTLSGLVLSLFFTATIISCKKDPTTGGGTGPTDWIDTVQPAQMNTYDLTTLKPYFFADPVIPADNELTEERIALGKKLFFDTRLSNDGSNCAKCHKPEYGFSMEGVSQPPPDNGLTSLPLINLAWYENFMWNGRIRGTVEDVMFMEVTKRFQTDLNKINGIDEYRIMFKRYYNVSNITANDLAKALAQFMRILVSKDTKDEAALKGQRMLTALEIAGRDIFFSEKGDCFHCHAKVIGTDNLLHNTGLDSGGYAKEIDKGYYNVTKKDEDLGKFRTANLRNVALRTHFMHDGRFTSLEEVVDFYDHGFKRVPNIDPVMLKPGKEDGLNLTDLEKKQLVAYLKTFTDSVMITNPAFKE